MRHDPPEYYALARALAPKPQSQNFQNYISPAANLLQSNSAAIAQPSFQNEGVMEPHNAHPAAPAAVAAPPRAARPNSFFQTNPIPNSDTLTPSILENQDCQTNPASCSIQTIHPPPATQAKPTETQAKPTETQRKPSEPPTNPTPDPPSPALDWDRLVSLAHREEILPTLQNHLDAPPEIADFFSGIYSLNQDRNRRLLAQLESLVSLLNRSGIEPVLLKGAAYLTTGVYPDPASRFLHDIDLLTAPAQTAQAVRLLESEGYEPFIPNPTALVLHHHPMLTRRGSVPVELHHSLGHALAQRILTPQEILDASTPVPLGSAAARIPSPEHLVVHTVVHSQIQHAPYLAIWPTLRSLLDLALLAQRFSIDWDAVRDRFRAHRASALLNLHLLQAQSSLGFQPPFALQPGGLAWARRRLLWAHPGLRRLDPAYFYAAVVSPKLRLSRRLLNHPTGRRYVLTTPFRAGFYKRLFEHIAHG